MHNSLSFHFEAIVYLYFRFWNCFDFQHMALAHRHAWYRYILLKGNMTSMRCCSTVKRWCYASLNYERKVGKYKYIRTNYSKSNKKQLYLWFWITLMITVLDWAWSVIKFRLIYMRIHTLDCDLFWFSSSIIMSKTVHLKFYLKEGKVAKFIRNWVLVERNNFTKCLFAIDLDLLEFHFFNLSFIFVVIWKYW